MPITLQSQNLNAGSSEKIVVNEYPNECPSCHKKIQAQLITTFTCKPDYTKYAQVIFCCPVEKCRELFIGTYQEHVAPNYFLSKVAPKKTAPVVFSDIIKNVSYVFPEIYNQANTAEENGLSHICGVGYRKALEFLIKDYLIGKDTQNADAIKKELLGSVINKRVSSPQLKEVAKRAVWLGNDETHYERKWEDKDVKDLKLLIELTIRWIETEKMTEQIMQDMPDPAK